MVPLVGHLVLSIAHLAARSIIIMTNPPLCIRRLSRLHKFNIQTGTFLGTPCRLSLWLPARSFPFHNQYRSCLNRLRSPFLAFWIFLTFSSRSLPLLLYSATRQRLTGSLFPLCSVVSPHNLSSWLRLIRKWLSSVSVLRRSIPTSVVGFLTINPGIALPRSARIRLMSIAPSTRYPSPVPAISGLLLVVVSCLACYIN